MRGPLNPIDPLSRIKYMNHNFFFFLYFTDWTKKYFKRQKSSGVKRIIGEGSQIAHEYAIGSECDVQGVS